FHFNCFIIIFWGRNVYSVFKIFIPFVYWLTDRQFDISPKFVKKFDFLRNSNPKFTKRDIINCSWLQMPGFNRGIYNITRQNLRKQGPFAKKGPLQCNYNNFAGNFYNQTAFNGLVSKY
ncbi:hypothetical protein PoMZ_09203, partial [Pyricularia oryzae]